MRRVIENKEAAPSHNKWTMDEESALVRMKAKHVSIKETALCILKDQHKQDLFATFRAISLAEKEAFIKEMTEFEKEGMKNVLDKGNQEEDGDKEAKI